ncbi:arginase family protein [Phyllobacterium sp. 628]|uniref:arginase family protein n=1 Tax=Phyllobacterium sp. 628 TaxID=2718938 RepID=UPI001662325B|nr:arginase family protein [Phyllobacterium sp. 628]QND52914.1 arginase family protein [Phyllobacterium sp. 628]
MQLLLLHLDDALELQPDFVRACMRTGARQICAEDHGRAVRLWGNQQSLDKLSNCLTRHIVGKGKTPHLSFMGSGDFHHITALLVAAALGNNPEPATLIHFDNHPDWVHFNNGMHCGSWINRALQHRSLEKIVTVGVCSSDLKSPERKGANLSLLASGRLELYPYEHAPSRVRKEYGQGASYEQKDGALNWKTIAEVGEQNFIDQLLSRIKTKAVYLTIDKDVLAREDAVTNWDQGRMRLPYVLSLITEISKRHQIIGADVTGDYSIPSYTGNLWTRFTKNAEILIDQPHSRPDPRKTTNINSSANHALLEVLSEAMA